MAEEAWKEKVESRSDETPSKEKKVAGQHG